MLSTDDIVAATQMLNRVHHIIDEVFSPHSVSKNRGRYELLSEVFAEDVVYDLSYRGLPVIHSVDEMIELCVASYQRDAKMQMGHHAMNIYVYEDDDGTVRAASKVICIFATGDLAAAGTATCFDFHDVLVKTPKGWRIKERTPITRWPNPQSFTLPETLELLRERLPG
jgi:hypothetical protein